MENQRIKQYCKIYAIVVMGLILALIGAVAIVKVIVKYA